MAEQADKRVLIIAGPNGAGKTTFAREFLPNEADCPVFVNADLIAAGLSPFAPERAAMAAGRLMLTQIRDHAQRGLTFAFETTLAGRRYARLIPRWQAAGYRVVLVFLWLPTVDMAIRRVATRVRQGGHAVPADIIRRRFNAGWHNFRNLYAAIVDTWYVYDNSDRSPVLLEESP